MRPTLLPQESVRRFRFFGSDGLYVDHLGRRVVADVEGAGVAWVEVTEAPLYLVRDEGTEASFRTPFTQSLLAHTGGPGDVSVAVMVGRDQPVQSLDVIEAPGKFAGAGWVVRAEGPLIVDERHDFAPAPSEALPVPFFRIAEAARLWIVPAETRCEMIDRFSIDDTLALKARGWRVQNISKVNLLASRFIDGDSHSGSVASHLNVAAWRVSLPEANDGLLLRKTYDRFHGRQRARVHVDGRFVGWWYEPGQDRLARWAVSDFGIPAEFTTGKSQIEIAIDPPAGAPLWSVGEISIWALRA